MNMYIERDGKQINLTPSEIELLYRAKDHQYHIEDVQLYFERQNKECPYDDSDADCIATMAQDILSNIDCYWDTYWYAYEEAIKEYERGW